VMGAAKLYWRVTGLRGLLRALRSQVVGAHSVIDVVRSDCKYPIRLRVPSSDVATFRQVFLNGEYDFQVASPPQVIIDAGANIGLASIYFANRYPQARILAIEPERSNFELLRENVAPYPNVTPLQAALWDKDEEIQLTDPGLGKWGFMTESKQVAASARSNTCHAVAARSVSTLLREFGLDRVDILKVDIEGAEKEVFQDTASWIGQVESIIVELHERMKPGCNRSFYCGSNGFDEEWQQGENVYLARRGYLRRPNAH
jgi:FkbM family methyltransferase